MRKALVLAGWNLRALSRNPRTYLCALMGFLLCFLLTDKVISLAGEYMTDVQIFEPFVWCFSDSDSVLFATLVLTLLLTELPKLDAPAAYMMFRANRASWLWGQILTVVVVCFGYTLFLLLSSILLSLGRVFIENRWSDTAILLSFSPAIFEVALNVVRKTVKLTVPYACALNVSLLITMYTLFLALLQTTLTIAKSKRLGVAVVMSINLMGYILTPERFMTWLQMGQEFKYYANLLSAWLSPLQHATYTMHNFGYDLLPRLSTSYIIMGGASILLAGTSFMLIRIKGVDFSGGAEYE